METNVTIRYIGPALDDGRMDVYKASANMIAFSEFMVAAVKTTYGDSAEAKAEVAGFEHGSFETNFIFSVAGQAATVFTALSPEQLWEVVKGAFALWKHLKGSPPSQVVNNGNTCTVTNNSGQVIQIRTDSLNLVFNEKASEPASKFVKLAMEEDGYEKLEISSSDSGVIAKVSKQEAQGFSSVTPSLTLSDNTFRMIVHVVGPVFQDGNKWRFSDGERPFNAAMLDGDFLMAVNSGERFGKGDILDVDMRAVQTGAGVKTSIERTILKVHRHLTPQEQTRLI